jgi:hypothetical protein
MHDLHKEGLKHIGTWFDKKNIGDFLPWDSINVQFDIKDEESYIWERIIDSLLKFWIDKLRNPKTQM